MCFRFALVQIRTCLTRVLFEDYLPRARGHGVDIALASMSERSIGGIVDSGVEFSGRDDDVLDADGDTPAVDKPDA